MADFIGANLPTISVTTHGPTRNTLTLDIPEHQVLIMMTGGTDENPIDEGYWHHILFRRTEGTSWVTCMPDGSLGFDDLSKEAQLVPLDRNAPFPVGGRPILAFDPAMSAETLERLRRDANRRAIYAAPASATAPGPPTASDAIWLYSDPAFPLFGSEVAADLLAQPRKIRAEGSVGLVDAVAGDFAGWTVMERVPTLSSAEWRREKQIGTGRDPRLLPVPEKRPAEAILFKDAFRMMLKDPPMHPMFQGPSAFMEVSNSIVSSGLEPPGWLAEFYRTSGVNPRSSLAVAYGNAVGTIWYLVCYDHCDGGQFTAIEHICRWILQVQKAVKRNPKQPDFEGLQPYMAHIAAVSGTTLSPAFDRHMAETMKAEGSFLKSERLNREERASAEEKRKKGKNKKEGDEQ